MTLDDAELDFLAQNMHILSPEEAEEVGVLLDELEKRRSAMACRDDLIEFCKKMQDDYKVGKHHRMLADELMGIADGTKDRVCVNMPPRHGKSQLVSIYYPAWFIGKFPNKKILMVSHTSDLAVDFGRKVRNIIDSPAYKEIFPTVTLAADSKSAGRWNTNAGGEYFACGVGSALAGRGADLLLVDDPHNEQDILSGNLDIFERAYEWFAYGARTRLMPGGRVAIIQCMTGDTPVLMADSSEKELKYIKVGDSVATYDDGKLSTSTVLNWAEQGSDKVFALKTTSRIIRANERHPFLVERNGVLEWVRLKNLKPGDQLVSLKDAINPQGQPLSPVNAKHVRPETATTENTQTPHIEGSATTESGKESDAQYQSAKSRHTVTVCANLTTKKHGGPQGIIDAAQKPQGHHISNIGMGSQWRITISSLLSKAASVLSVSNLLPKKTPGYTGKINSASITATTPEESGRFYVMTATSLLDTQKLERSPSQLPTISDFTTETIEGISYAGEEIVYDIQVERTENFIANNLVSHNTRWHQDDLTGRMVRDMTQNEGSDQYEVVEFPAIFNENTPQERPLWPEFFDLDALKRTKASMPVFQWNAQYQQNPTGEEAAIVKRDWWQIWKAERPPSCEYVIMALDAAAETNNRADFTSITTWGVFLNENTEAYNIILLNAIKKRVEFPELKDLTWEQYNEYEPDAFIVEKKSAGTALYQELRRTGMVIQEYTPHRGSGDKTARLNSVADIIRSGLVWVPETRWAEEVVEEIAGFPFMSNDDHVDTTTMALMRFRNGGFVRLPSDEPDDPQFFKARKRAYY